MRVHLFTDDDVEIEGRLLPHFVTIDEVGRTWPQGLIGEEDADWDWPTIASLHSAADWSCFELQFQDRAQGLMVVKRRHELRAPANTGAEGCYIEYVASAPWNRPPTGDTRHPRVKPVGQILVDVAIRLSMELGYHGRLGWHSKAGAEEWYKRSMPGIWSGGPDISEGGLEYFELPALLASNFMADNSRLYVGD